MKQTVLCLVSALLISGASWAQNKQLPPSPYPFTGNAVNKAIPVPRAINDNAGIPYNQQHRAIKQNRPPLGQSASATVSEAVIGFTYYDLQTNASIRNGFLNHGDGTFSAVWTLGPTSSPGQTYPDRGTGYVYFDGTNWGSAPMARLEAVRTGWPSIATTSTGKEVIVSHMTANPGIDYLSRPAKGTGAWAEDMSILGAGVDDTWSRVVTGGANGESVHVIANGSGVSLNAYFGQIGPVLYSRSTDNGVTFPGQNLRTLIPDLDSSNYFGFGGDSYHMDTQGDDIVIGASDFSTDVVVVWSNDNGSTWSSQVLLEFPIPFYDDATMITDIPPFDGIADTITAGAGDIHVAFDNNGLIHAWFSVVRVFDDDPSGGLSFFPVTDGLYYWNENMGTNPPVLIGYAPDLNNDGVISLPDASQICPNDPFPFGLYRGGVTQMPTAGFDANNNIYVAYQTVDELSDTLAFFKTFRHTYIIKSLDGGTTWTTPENALDLIYETQPNDAPFLECVFANMAKKVDSHIHLTYQRDFAPGHSLADPTRCDYTNNTGQVNEIVYTKFEPNDVPLGIGSPAEELPSFTVSNNYPNPAEDLTQISIRLDALSDITVTVTDVMGKEVYRETKTQLPPGNHHVTLSVSAVAAGLYTYTVTDGSHAVSKKMMVQ